MHQDRLICFILSAGLLAGVSQIGAEDSVVTPRLDTESLPSTLEATVVESEPAPAPTVTSNPPASPREVVARQEAVQLAETPVIITRTPLELDEPARQAPQLDTISAAEIRAY
ncbi:MAG: hypothetical protein AAF236_15405, partial [Verrucomicrobiota bacterium]